MAKIKMSLEDLKKALGELDDEDRELVSRALGIKAGSADPDLVESINKITARLDAIEKGGSKKKDGFLDSLLR